MTAGIVALAAFVAFGLAGPAFAAGVTNTLKMVKVNTNEHKATTSIQWFANEHILAAGAHGFGVLTDQEHAAVIVETTHAGIKDSNAQVDASDANWHTHFVVLGEGDNPLCGPDHYVKDIMYEQPGSVKVSGNKITASGLPASFTGTSALTGKPLTISPGTNAQAAMSFDLEPKFDEGGFIQAVCVTHIQFTDHFQDK